VAIDREKVLQAAQKYVEKKKYDKAILEYQRLIQADPNDARTLLKVGDLQSKMGAYPDAISTYETVGKLYSQQGFALKAIAVYKQIREIIAKHVPQLEERYGHIAPKLAELYQSLGLTSDALAALDEVATRLQRQQKDAEAIEVFRKIVELDPTNPLPHLRLAEAFSRVKDIEGAVFEFKTAASQLAGLGRRDDALKVLERLLHHQQDPEQARIAAELYLARGQAADGMQALAKLQVCFQANPRDIDTLGLLARAFTTIGQAAKAIEVQKEMARVARDSGKTDLFREIVERLMRVAPHDDGVRKLASQSMPHQAVQAPPPPPAPAYAPQAAAPQYPPQPQGAFAQTQGYGSPGAPAAHAPEAPSAEYGEPEAAYEEQVEELYEEAEAAVEGDAAEYDEASVEAYELVEEGDLVDEDAPMVEAGAYEEAPAGDYEDAAPEVEAGEAVAAEEYDQAYEQAPDTSDQVAQVLADAQSFRRVRLYAKALETLRIGLEIEPRSMELHESYRDVLIEAGYTTEAVEEMLVIAGLYVDTLDGESAARALQDVLAFDPHNERAVAMLQELGYEIVDEGAEGEAPYEEQAYEEGAQDDRLPSYDLEEMGPSDVSGAYHDPNRIVAPVAPAYETPAEPYAEEGAYAEQGYGEQGYDEGGYAEQGYEGAEGAEAPAADDPFAAPGGEALPSFPLEAAQEHAAADDDDGNERTTFATGVGARAAASAPAPARRPSQMPRIQDLEEALEESEFFISRGLVEDARAILVEQLSMHPNHPLLEERIAEIDQQLDAAQRSGSGTREKPREDRAFDIAASLDSLEEPSPVQQQAGAFDDPSQQVDVEEVFRKFKEGVAKQISVEDSESHYNLGIAYKEMGLVDDAIREFDVAARDPKRECVCRSMIGMIHTEQGRLNEAIDAFVLGLNAQIKEPQQETMLCYEIGSAYEAKKLSKEALSYYQKAMRRDPNYKDVQERVRRLSRGDAKPPPRQVAVGADDEFDRAFDDLLKS